MSPVGLRVVGWSVETVNEVDGAQVRVALQHFELTMSRDRADFGDAEALLEQPRDRLMSQIVEVKVRHAGANAQVFECQPHAVTAHRKYAIGVATGPCEEIA